MHFLVIEHSMMSLSFQTAIQKNKAKLSYFVQFENEMMSYMYCALKLNKAQIPMFKLFWNIVTYRVTS